MMVLTRLAHSVYSQHVNAGYYSSRNYFCPDCQFCNAASTSIQNQPYLEFASDCGTRQAYKLSAAPVILYGVTNQVGLLPAQVELSNSLIAQQAPGLLPGLFGGLLFF